MSSGEMVMLGHCFNCGSQMIACPECVNTVRVDPETNMPPDVVIVGGEPVHNPSPDPAAVARAEKRLLCDTCVSRRNERTRAGGPDAAHHFGIVELAADRHRRNHQ